MRLFAVAAVTVVILPRPIAAEDSLATLRVRVVHDSTPVERAIVRAGSRGGQTDARGLAALRLPPGVQHVAVARIGYSPESLTVTLRAGQDTTVAVALRAQAAEIENVVISATRTEKRIEDEPLRVAGAGAGRG
jgi:uncharacterized membrane protein